LLFCAIFCARHEVLFRAFACESGNCIFCRQSIGWLKIHDAISRFVAIAPMLQPGTHEQIQRFSHLTS